MKTTLLATCFLAACGAHSNPSSITAAAATAPSPSSPSNEPVSGGGPANGSCSDAAGTLVYTNSHYEGGAAPFPGMVIGEQKVVYQGNVAGDTILREGGTPAPTPPGAAADGTPWTLGLSFVDGTKQVLESSGNAQAGSVTFAQKLQVTFLQGLGPSIDSNQFTAYVICQDGWNELLP